MKNLRLRHKNPAFFLLVFLLSFSGSSCVSHLKEAKVHYGDGERYSRSYQKEKAFLSYKKALEEAELETVKNPSAQAFMLKGMAELRLELWEEAEESFLEAFSFGFEKGEEWAKQVSLLGLAFSLEEMGLQEASLKIYVSLMKRPQIEAVALPAAQRYTEDVLEKALFKEGKEKEKLLRQLFSDIEKLSQRDLSCGFYHYLLSQILGHLEDYPKSFEEAVLARELGLPSEEILRDNDLQIVFCTQRLKERLPLSEWEEFDSVYQSWWKRWGWKDSVTPAWQKR